MRQVARRIWFRAWSEEKEFRIQNPEDIVNRELGKELRIQTYLQKGFFYS